jgi:hypothetical protein
MTTASPSPCAISKSTTWSRPGCFLDGRDGSLPKFLNPSLLTGERAVARVEGWILGVM